MATFSNICYPSRKTLHSWYNGRDNGRGKQPPPLWYPEPPPFPPFCHPNRLSNAVPEPPGLSLPLPPQETPAHSQDNSARRACQPVFPLSCGTTSRAVDLASGSPLGPSAASPWVTVTGRVGLGKRCKLGVGLVPSVATSHVPLGR